MLVGEGQQTKSRAECQRGSGFRYPPDKQKKTTRTVLEQAILLCGDWAETTEIIYSKQQ